MPSFKRARGYRKKLRAKRRRMIPRSIRPRQQVTNIVRTFHHMFWQPSATTTTDFWKYYQPSLADLPNYTEFTAVFDNYRINRIKFVFRPRFDSFSGNDNTDTTLPGITNQQGVNLHVIVDQRSRVTSPTGTYLRSNLNTFLENGRVKSYNGNKAVTVYYKPSTYQTLSGGSAAYLWSPWISCSLATQPHPGFHVFAQDINMTGTFGQSWDVFVTYYMQFKGSS